MDVRDQVGDIRQGRERRDVNTNEPNDGPTEPIPNRTQRTPPAGTPRDGIISPAARAGETGPRVSLRDRT